MPADEPHATKAPAAHAPAASVALPSIGLPSEHAALVPELPEAPAIRGAVPRGSQALVMELHKAQVDITGLRHSLERLEEETSQTRTELSTARRRFLKLSDEAADLRRALQRAEVDLPWAGVRRALEAILPALDSLEPVLSHLRSQEHVSETSLEGLEMLRAEFQRGLATLRVEPFDAVGERFDPVRHDAIARRPTRETPAGLVVRQVSCGYLLDGQLLRSARVVVAVSPDDGFEGLTEELAVDIVDDTTDIGELVRPDQF